MKRQSKRTVKLLFTFVAMVITFCMAVFGVFAATNIAYDGSGSFKFTVGKNVATTISGSYQNSTNTVSGAIKFTDNQSEGYDETGFFPLDGTNTDYTDGAMQLPTGVEFASHEDVFTYTFNVTNDLDVNNLSIKFTASANNPLHLTVGTPNYTVDGAALELNASGFAILAPQKTLVITVTIQPNASEAGTLESGFTSALYTFGLTIQRAE